MSSTLVQEVRNLPTPDFSFDPDAPGACIAGVRPYRTGSYRLDAGTESGRFVVHNYGHGGAGLTLGWGCAAKVRDLVRGRVAASQDTEAAVLGAGVMGLCAATLLLDLGLKVVIYTDRALDETTSFKAGGQWAVSLVTFAGRERELKDIIKASYTRLKSSIGKGFGVSEAPFYSAKRSENLEVVRRLLPGLLPEPVRLPRMPFEGHTKPGYRYRTLMVEPPVFLRRLEADLRTRGAMFVHQGFVDKADVFRSVPQKIIVNCTGLGAKALWADSRMLPMKGQLAMLPAQPELGYLYGQNGYMFPRSDHVVIGGTFEEGVNDEVADKAVCKGLVEHVASLFGRATPRPMPEIHIHHPRNAPMVDLAMPEPF